MGRLRLVSLAGRPWRLYAVPAACLLAATVAIGLLRGELRSSPGGSPAAARHAPARAQTAPHRRSYVVRPGDTIEAISARTGVPQARILSLNPRISPTSLFIGQRLRLP